MHALFAAGIALEANYREMLLRQTNSEGMMHSLQNSPGFVVEWCALTCMLLHLIVHRCMFAMHRGLVTLQATHVSLSFACVNSVSGACIITNASVDLVREVVTW
jgi:hypothetical protein